MNSIYFDNNATTPLAPEVAELMASLHGRFGNPSSVHHLGRETRRLIEESRERIASLVGAKPSEIYFTSGGSEAIHMALWGTALRPKERSHLIVSAVEHASTLKTAAYLETLGVEVTYVDVDSNGALDPTRIAAAILPHTRLIAVMFANNEIGNIYPVKKIGEIARGKGVPFFCDAVQVLGKMEIRLEHLPIDLLSAAAHKFHGPKGAGFLYVREGTQVKAAFHGGRQERGLRPGTENIQGIAGMAKALEISLRKVDLDFRKIRALRDRLQGGIQDEFPEAIFHGDPEHHLHNTLNFRIPGVSGEALLLNLDLAGVAASLGSACDSGSLDPSHVLLAMGLSPEEALGGLRFSLSRYNTEAEVDEVLRILPQAVNKVRNGKLENRERRADNREAKKKDEDWKIANRTV